MKRLRRYKIIFNKLLNVFGVDPRKILAIKNFPRYIKDYRKYKILGGVVSDFHLILDNFHEQAGSAKGHYFHSDLVVANQIFKKNPRRHVDIGSRIDGFVAHVASFRKIEVIDIRDLEDTGHENIIFKRDDIFNPGQLKVELSDSLSCLHVIEHFGLGRYGDAIDPLGHQKGFNEILKRLEKDGMFYVSIPIGRKNEVHFNAHRVFHPLDILSWPTFGCDLSLERFDYIDDTGHLRKNININAENINVVYGCGIYHFKKISSQ